MINKFDGEYAFLSNYYNSPFTIDGITFPTVEHWFQAYKTTDEKEFKKIAGAPTPGAAKRLGRQVSLRSDWEEIKDTVMMEGLVHKFAIPELKEKLLATGDEELIEGTTWHDRTWGICTCSKCKGQGENRLGKALMKIRTQIKNL